MPTKAIITSCSNKFFPSVINLLTSIKANYPDHPPIYVYDLGLFSIFRKELSLVEGVTVVPMPHFCPHWRSCYTWKTYIFKHPPADLNFYIDAGCQILQPLEQDFRIIDKENLLLIDISCRFDELVPVEYRSIFNTGDGFNSLPTMHAGIIGFKKTPEVSHMFELIYDAAVVGLALGFSPDNAWRNKGKDKNPFVRNSLLFRHDQTLLNLFYRICFSDSIPFQPIHSYSGEKNNNPDHRVLHLRLTWKFLPYTDITALHNKESLLFTVNRIILFAISVLKYLKLSFKSFLGRL